MGSTMFYFLGYVLYFQPAFTCSKLATETREQGVKYVQSCQWRRSGVFIVKFEHISRLILVFLLLTLPAGL